MARRNSDVSTLTHPPQFELSGSLCTQEETSHYGEFDSVRCSQEMHIAARDLSAQLRSCNHDSRASEMRVVSRSDSPGKVNKDVSENHPDDERVSEYSVRSIISCLYRNVGKS